VGKASTFDRVAVPSIVVDGEFNYVLNPGMRIFGQLKIGRACIVFFDPRL